MKSNKGPDKSSKLLRQPSSKSINGNQIPSNGTKDPHGSNKKSDSIIGNICGCCGSKKNRNDGGNENGESSGDKASHGNRNGKGLNHPGRERGNPTSITNIVIHQQRESQPSVKVLDKNGEYEQELGEGTESLYTDPSSNIRISLKDIPKQLSCTSL